MKRIVRDRFLTPAEVEENRKTIAAVEKEFPPAPEFPAPTPGHLRSIGIRPCGNLGSFIFFECVTCGTLYRQDAQGHIRCNLDVIVACPYCAGKEQPK